MFYKDCALDIIGKLPQEAGLKEISEELYMSIIIAEQEEKEINGKDKERYYTNEEAFELAWKGANEQLSKEGLVC